MTHYSDFDLEKKMKTSFLFGGSAAYLEEQFEAYLVDPESISPEWRAYFDQLPPSPGDVSHQAIKDYFEARAQQPLAFQSAQGGSDPLQAKQCQVFAYIRAYREWGHRLAQLDPLGLRQPDQMPELALSSYQLSNADFSTTFETGDFSTIGKKQATLKDIDQSLKAIYAQSLGMEYLYIPVQSEREWIQAYIEPRLGRYETTTVEKRHILSQLVAAEGLERYLGSRFVGQKRFSLEGGESFIPLLDKIIRQSAQNGVKEVAIGMAHRGRLNVLVNVMGKAPEKLFAEFEGHYDETTLSGDVKYHKGYAAAVQTEAGPVHLVLGFNPSHLEIIGPVLEGGVKARQNRREDDQGHSVLPVIVHGDAAFSGQGIVMENFALGLAEGFTTGGTLHVVINNQIGFTTNHPIDTTRHSYSTDIAKMVNAPILHVNSDDPEAVVFAAQFAFDYRQRFSKDIVIDLICYRRFGHNEADEPSMTQPLMYQTIKSHATTLSLYSQTLIKEGIVSEEQYKTLVNDYREALKVGEPVVKLIKDYQLDLATDWTPYWGQPWTASAKTGVSLATLQRLGAVLTQLPDELSIQPQVAREYEARKAMLAGQQALHWGMAEALAYASLIDEGFNLRLTGQDVQRGTFSHRHAVLHDMKTDRLYCPLESLAKHSHQVQIYDSILSEEAVLAFEYGYASSSPETLTIWEAQYGDFYNGAQMVVDQFISSSEQKWGLLCGLVMQLPHGLEGGGPEHSSARLERFLQLCAQENIQVVFPTTPAQCFHLLRRQLLRTYRKPLVIMSPKSLLRHKAAVSSLEELATGQFQTVIDEIDRGIEKAKVTRLIMTFGKIYYDLVQERVNRNDKETAIIRIEQLYPFPEADLAKVISHYAQIKQVVFCQDEPENQGAWYFCKDRIRALLGKEQDIKYAGRPEAAAPAVGSGTVHLAQQVALIEAAFSI